MKMFRMSLSVLGMIFLFLAYGQAAEIHEAAQKGDLAAVKALLEKDPALVNAKDENGRTPLHWAARGVHLEVMRYLVEKGAEVNALDNNGIAALHSVASRGHAEAAHLLIEKGADQSPPLFPALAGEYLGQKKPGTKPEVFAKGIVSGRYGLHSNVVFSPDGKEALWSIQIPPRGRGYGSGKTMVSRQVNGRWIYPKEAVFGDVPLDDVPLFHPSGMKLYDMANRPLTPGGSPGKENIWVWENRDGQWTNPRPLPEVVNNNPLHWQFGVDRKENVYLILNIPGTLGESDIYISRFVDGRYDQPENLGPFINTANAEEFPFIDPDGRYLLFVRDFDIYVSFRDVEGKWGEPRLLGPEVNTQGWEVLPVVSPDGKYLFFSRNQDIWWVDAQVIEDVRNR